MTDIPLLLDETGSVVESGEQAFRRIAARKLAERGCPSQNLEPAVERLLATGSELRLAPDLLPQHVEH